MRRLAIVAVALLCGCAFLITGCDDGTGSTEGSDTSIGSGTSDGTSDGAATSATRPVSTTVVVLGDYALWAQTLKYESLEDDLAVNVTVFAPEDSEDADGMTDKGAHRLVAMRVRLDNVGGTDAVVAPSWFKIKDADGVAYQGIKVTGVDLDPLEAGTFKPGDRVEGYLFFEMPDDAAVTLAVFDLSEGADAGAVRTWSE